MVDHDQSPREARGMERRERRACTQTGRRCRVAQGSNGGVQNLSQAARRRKGGGYRATAKGFPGGSRLADAAIPARRKVFPPVHGNK